MKGWLAFLGRLGSMPGADLAYIAGMLILASVFASELRTGWGLFVDFNIALLFFAVFLAGPTLLLVALGRRIGRPYLHVPLPSATLAYLVYRTTLSNAWSAWFTLGLGLSWAVMGAAARALVRNGRATSRSAPAGAWPTLQVGMLGSVVLLNITSFVFLTWPGDASRAREAELDHAPLGAVAGLSDPSQPGSYKFHTLTYGSGSDARQPEYGPTALLKTSTVDGWEIMPSWPGDLLRSRESYWGFDAGNVPVNGRVWMPIGDGPFPLVLVVHGNANMTLRSETGYAYLGEVLASRGYVVAAIDENFLNGNLFTFMILPGVNLAEDLESRVWLLLHHVHQWQRWVDDPHSPFHGHIDLGRMAFIGHSRGGEAAAVAAEYLARTRIMPDVHVQSVVALAPSDSRYPDLEHPLQLRDLNYLTLFGALDADIVYLDGLNQFLRTSVQTPGRFKASLLIDSANHGQFNSAWGPIDATSPGNRLLNRSAVMSGQDQRRVTTVYVAAFLDATLKGMTGYTRLFEDYRSGAAWLPDSSAYTNRFVAATDHVLANFDEDADPATLTISSGRVVTSAIQARELTPKVGRTPWLVPHKRDTRVLTLGWERPGAVWEVDLTDATLVDWVAPDTVLAFDVANLGRDPSTRKRLPEPAQLDFTIELTDAEGHRAGLPSSWYAPLRPPFDSRPFKTDLVAWRTVTLTTYELPMSAFMAANPDFLPARLASLAFRFDLSSSGMIALDDLVLRLLSPGARSVETSSESVP